MAKHYCIVPGCNEAGRHQITVRCRRPDTTAVWAPATGAHLCDKHATEGGELDITFRPKRNGKLTTSVWSEYRGQAGTRESRTIPITQGAYRTHP